MLLYQVVRDCGDVRTVPGAAAGHRPGVHAMMHSDQRHLWRHDHSFQQDQRHPGERRTIAVAALTGVTMLVEIGAGVMSGSMALLADGLHMASHFAALGISAFVYVYARRHAHDPGFSFGTGKMNALGGFTGAIVLALFALAMIGESFMRFFRPVSLDYQQALPVALFGLAVNGASIALLGAPEHGERHDFNLRAVYAHVLADLLTSVLAIGALVAVQHAGALWVDAAVGILGGGLVIRWAVGLFRQTGAVLLDRVGPEDIRRRITENIERDGMSMITDFHLWSIAPDRYALEMCIISCRPESPDAYRERIPRDIPIAHAAIEVQPCTSRIARCARQVPG